MSEIIPAILSKEVGDVNSKLKQVEKLVTWAQIDIADGDFVNNKTVTVEQLKGIQTSLNLEAHLMVLQPEQHLIACKKANIGRVIIHLETIDRTSNQIFKEINRLDMEVGIALNPDTPVPQVLPYLKRIHVVLFMSVHPGFQAQAFIPGVLDRIKELKEYYSETKIAVDGGINTETIQKVAHAGVDYIDVGSALFGTGGIENNYHQLQSLINT